MTRWKSVALLAGAALLVVAGATARSARASGTVSHTFNFTGGLQTFTVPNGVTTLTIRAVGAAGGEGQAGFPAMPASMQGDFAVTPGETLTILAGEFPLAEIGGPGGGGSFVWTGTGGVTTDNLLLAAGGGGGEGCLLPGGNASLTPDGGGSDAGNPGGSGGNGGAGGSAGGTDIYPGSIPGGGGGGAGILTSGGDGEQGVDGPSQEGIGSGQAGPGGQAISLGGSGGIVYLPPFQPNQNGGYGGGGASAWGGAGGGGGGYSGGGGGTADNPNNATSLGGGFGCDGGGGGGSFNAGMNQDNHLTAENTYGFVTVSYPQTDVTVPTITASATSDGNPYTGGTWTNAPVVVHFDCTDDDSGVASVSPDQTVSSEGSGQSVTGTCTDNAGNSADATFSDIQIDRTAPSITASTGSYVPGTLTNQAVVVHFDCTDGTSGVASVTGDQTVSGDGTGQSVTGTCVDNAGNSASATVSDIDVDQTAPSITASAGPYVAGTWTNQDVTVHFGCSDASGVASVSPDDTVSSEGAGQSVTGTCTDIAGNTAQATFSGIDIDKTAPSLSLIALNGNGDPYTLGDWSATPITVHVNCDDPLSDIASVTPNATFDDGANQSFTATCVDNAGNSSQQTLAEINVDTQAPSITASATSNGNPYAGGVWTNHNVVVHFTCTDGGSGVATVTPDQTLSSDGDNQSVTGTCTDQSNQSASATFTGIRIDKTAPSVTYTGNNVLYGLNDTVSIHCASSDATSGVASDTCADISGPAWSFGPGSHTYSATATDNAGNTGSNSTTFTVNVTFAGLEGLVSQFCTNPGVANGLNAKLDAASAAKARGQTKTEQNQLNAFGNQVNAQTGKCLTPGQAALLLQFASAL